MVFSWLMSLLFSFGNNSKAVSVQSSGFSGTVDGHVLPADNLQPSAPSPANVDGGGGH
jgi:hypothetical protein